MALMLIHSDKSTYIYNQYPDNNFSNFNKLIISNIKKSNKCYIINTLLRFPSYTFKNKQITITNLYLLLPLNQICYLNKNKKAHGCIKISSLPTHTKLSKVTWNTLPPVKIDTISPINCKDLNSNFKLIDLSSIIDKSICYDNAKINLMLSLSCDNFYIEMERNNLLLSPKILITYIGNLKQDTECYPHGEPHCVPCCESVNYPCCEPNCKCDNSPVGLQLHLTNKSPRLIANNEVIKFDTIVLKTDFLIMYDKLTGKISIKEKGYYFCQWIINLVGSSDVKDLSISLKNITSDTTVASSSPVVLMGQYTGNALVEVTEGNEVFTLINTSGGTLNFSDLDICASLSIIRI